MIKLNLEANNKQEEIIKDYLENNISEVLADKINNGVQIVKDNKTLLNKKDLNGFWKFATEEARKTAEKGSNCAYVDDKTVFGWAIHYFEEDSIEGNLYNEDGTEYKTQIKSTPKVETKPQKQESKQQNLFDFFDNQPTKKLEETRKENDKKQENIIIDKDNTKIDVETSEILDEEITIQHQTFDKFQLKTISVLLDGKVVLK